MKKEGIDPDVVCYTTLIDAYNRINNISKCWELFEEYRIFESGK
jgi:pentatricopeptide repeat protein